MNNETLTSRTHRQKSTWLYWLIGATISTLLMGLIALFGDLRYATNDDGVMLRAFMGFNGATLPTFHMILHTVLVYPLNWLSTAFPGIAWFSYMQLFFLWLCSTVSVKSILCCMRNNDQPLWAGLIASVAYLCAFLMTYCCLVSFTATAAILGAAAVLQLLSIDYRRATDGQIVRGCILSLLLVVLAYGLRQTTALPILAFCGLAFALVFCLYFGIGRKKQRSMKPLVISALIVAVVFGALVGLRELEISQKGMGEYLRWQRARVSVMDYDGLKDLPDELLDEIGWSRAEIGLIDKWYYMDQNITSEALEKIAAYRQVQNNAGFFTHVNSGLSLISELVKVEPIAMRSVWLIGGVIVLCILGLCLGGWRKRKNINLVCIIAIGATLFLSAALLLYLGMEGRLLLRAALLIILPAAAMLFGLLPVCLPPCRSLRKPQLAVLLACACGCLALSLCYTIPAVQAIARPSVSDTLDGSEDASNAFADLDEYAAENPDLLLIYDNTFISDVRMFPTVKNGVSANVIFWGGWGARSPEYMAQLAAFSIDGNTCDASIFLNENVRLVRGLVDDSPDALLDYLHEIVGPDIDYGIDTSWGGAHVFQIY